MSLVVRRPDGRQLSRGVAALAVCGVGIAVIAFHEGIAVQRGWPPGALVGLGAGIIAVGAAYLVLTVRRSLSAAPAFMADASRVRFQTALQTLELTWEEIDSIRPGTVGGSEVLLVVPRRASLSTRLLGVPVPGGAQRAHVIHDGDLELTPAMVVERLKAFREP